MPTTSDIELNEPAAWASGAEDPPPDALDHLMAIKERIAGHFRDGCPRCKAPARRYWHDDHYDSESMTVNRWWLCNECFYLHWTAGIPFADWRDFFRNAWYVDVRRGAQRRQPLQCPTCARMTLEHWPSGLRTFLASTHLTLSCTTPGCEFTRREITTSLRTQIVAMLAWALPWALFIAVMRGSGQ